MVASKADLRQQAEVTFAIGQHAMKDLTAVFRKTPRAPQADRLPPEDFARLRTALASGPVPLQFDDTSEDRLRKLREAYEPYANTLSHHFMMPLPRWVPAGTVHHNWQIDNPARPALFRA
jgi:hypothetical protein